MDTFFVNVVGLLAHLWCYDLFKKIGDVCGGLVDVNCNLADLGRVRVYVRKKGKGVGVYGGGKG